MTSFANLHVKWSWLCLVIALYFQTQKNRNSTSLNPQTSARVQAQKELRCNTGGCHKSALLNCW